MKFGHLMAVVLLCGLFVTAQTPQEFPSTSGNAFVRLCSVIDKSDEDTTRPDVLHIFACIGYVEGVVQGVAEEIGYAHAVTDKAPPAPFCLLGDVENGQIVKIVLKYVRVHPEKAHHNTSMLIVEALRESFPCRSK